MKIIVVLLLTMLAGCAQIRVQKQLEEYEEQFNPLIGVATKENILLDYGIPTRKESLNDIEVWEYRKTRGVQGGAYFNNQTGTAFGGGHEVYDKITFTFKSEVLHRWKAYVQR